MPRKKRYYTKGKLSLYFDEDFPQELIDHFKRIRAWKKKVRILSVSDKKNYGKDDKYQFNHCKKNGLTLVTLDKGFMDDKKYPINQMPGIIRIVARKNEIDKIEEALNIFIGNIYSLQFPKWFMGDTKAQISTSSWIIRGRAIRTREIKEAKIFLGEGALQKLMDAFNYHFIVRDKQT